ncbi:hypothetical protein [Ilumatobacter sp.]|uniref:hypothetical protein n=1 Tax=Ilumatobacter sp. TaxID=1967498 RepID=UPI003B51DF80
MLTQTVGDPDRGERMARAVLDDDAARAQVVAPISSSVMSTTGLPTSRSAQVSDAVDRALREPSGAQAFIDPFAGSWARVLGEDDPRPAVFDLAPVVDDIGTELLPAGVDPSVLGSAGVAVPAVSLPGTPFPWLGDVRRGVASAVVPMALVAGALALIALVAAGDRRWVVRRIGVWAVLAGALWVAVPPIAVQLARWWVRGSDALVEVAVREATSGLRPAAIALVALGVAAVVGSLVWPRSVPERAVPTGAHGRARRGVAHATTPGPTTPATPRSTVARSGPAASARRAPSGSSAPSGSAPSRRRAGSAGPSSAPTPTPTPTPTSTPTTRRMPSADAPTGETPVTTNRGPDEVDLWEFYR